MPPPENWRRCGPCGPRWFRPPAPGVRYAARCQWRRLRLKARAYLKRSCQYPVASEFPLTGNWQPTACFILSARTSTHNPFEGLLPRRLLPIELVVLDERLRILGSGRGFRIGGNPVHGAQYHQFRIAFLRALASEKITQDRNVTQAGNFVPNVGNPIIDQARDHETLPILQLKFGLSLARAQGGDGKTGDGKGVCEIQSADLGGNGEGNVAVRHDHRGELELHAKFLERDGNVGG